MLLKTVAPLVDALETTWRSIGDLCADLDDEAWDRVALPGWTIKDVISHIIGVESRLLGRPDPEVDGTGDWPHVRNEFTALMEPAVEARRGATPAAVLNEFGEVTSERLAALRRDHADDEEVADTPYGSAPLWRVLSIRLLDSWYHEQDVRRTVGVHGHLEGPAAEHCRDLSLRNMGARLGREVGGDGVVVLDIRGPSASVTALDLATGRPLDAVPDAPTVRLTTDLETLVALGGGRIGPGDAAGRVAVEGDTALAERVLAHLAFTP